MKIHLLRLFFCLFLAVLNLPSLNAQSISELNRQVDSLIYNTSDNSKALTLAQTVLKRAEQELSKTDTNYANALDNLATIYFQTEQFSQVEPLLLRSLAIRKNQLTEKPIAYATLVEKFASFYHDVGRLRESEEFYIKLLPLAEIAWGRQSYSYLKILNDLGLLYAETNRLKHALGLLSQIPSILIAVYGEKNIVYGQFLNSFAYVCQTMRLYPKSDSLYRDALTILVNDPDKKSGSYASAMSGLAMTLYLQKEYAQAITFYQKALTVTEEQLGRQHSSYARNLNNLGNAYRKAGRLLQAGECYNEMLTIYRNIYGENHPNYVRGLSNQARLFDQIGNFPRADSLYQVVYVGESSFSRQFNQSMTEQENTSAQERFTIFVNHLNSFYYRHVNQFPRASDLLANNALYQKGNQLLNLVKLRQRIANSQDTTLSNLFERWIGQKRRLMQIRQRPLRANTGNLTTEEETANQLEKELTQRSQAFKLANEQNTIRWQDVQKRLKPGEAAVEFIHFPYYNGIDETDTMRYMALVLRPGDMHPKLISLFNESSLDSLLHWAGSSAERISQLYAPISGRGKKLYNLVWQPLAPLLATSRVVYVSPSGLLNRVSLGAIPTPTGQFLADRYDIRQRMSLRELVTPTTDTRLSKNSRAIVYGGIQYEADSLALRQSIPLKTNQTVAYRRSLDSTRGGSWGTLLATLTEAKTIDQLLRTNAIRSELRTGWQANEESVKALENGQSPAVIHLATHGFFYPEPLPSDKNTFKSSENPLLRSGLVLAGANRVWRGGKPIDGLEDGILTAYEVANLNLSNTRLVTLSACETGLGDIRGAEGVYGLQRAFRLAGVPTMLVSLWRVPDRETAQMMQLFYANYGRGIPIETAFREAQKVMRRLYSPYYWGAFILVR